MKVIFLNDNFVSADKAKVSIEDRGFQFSDGLYEVVRTFKGFPFKLKEHLERLKRGAEEIKLKLPYSLDAIAQVVKEGLEKLGEPTAEIYIQVTRGSAPRSHLPSPRLTPTFIVIFKKFTPLKSEYFEKGVEVIPLPDMRWGRCDIKSTMLLPNVLAKMEAKEKGFFDAILIKDGYITESTSSSFFLLKDGRLKTHPADRCILPSITRKVVIEIAKKEGIEVIEEKFGLEEAYNSQEAFLCGTNYDILPVVKIGSHPLSGAKLGEITQKIIKEYKNICNQT